METLMSPATCTCALSIGLNPARSNMSLLASSCTYSLLAFCARLATLCTAIAACVLNAAAVCCIRYCCTCGSFILFHAVTLPLFPSAYPASAAALVRLPPFATYASTSALCLAVILSLVAGALATMSAPPVSPPHIPLARMAVNAQRLHPAIVTANCDRWAIPPSSARALLVGSFVTSSPSQ